MTIAITDADTDTLGANVREVLEKASPTSTVRELMGTEQGWTPSAWRRLCAELGPAGVAVSEQYGGSGLSSRELALVFESAGRTLLCAPLFAVAGLSIPLLVALDDAAVNATLLPQLVSGDVVATVVTADGGGRHGVEHLGVEAVGDVLSGRAGYVIDGGFADLILVPARSSEGVAVYLVPADAPGLSIRPLVTLDQTRKQAALEFRCVPAVRVGAGDSTAAVEHAYDVARAMLASELSGVMSRCLEMTVEFAKTRIQFGRPIGSFQATKQKLADLLVGLESSRSAAGAAAVAAATGHADLGWVAAAAKAYGSETASRVTAETIQIHGGVGFTWEHDAHLFFKRARATEEMLGTSRELYDKVAAHVATS